MALTGGAGTLWGVAVFSFGDGCRRVGAQVLVRAVAVGDGAGVSRLLRASPGLAHAHVEHGATRQDAQAYYLDEIEHYLYAGDTALHIAGAGYRSALVRTLITVGADVSAKNRRGAEPLHYAADGVPGSTRWSPREQAMTVASLIASGTDPNATDVGGVTPLHRAVRTRCAAAVQALLDGGADVRRKNKSGSTPFNLATQNTGRGGTGSIEARAQQIVRLLERTARRERYPKARVHQLPNVGLRSGRLRARSADATLDDVPLCAQHRR